MLRQQHRATQRLCACWHIPWNDPVLSCNLMLQIQVHNRCLVMHLQPCQDRCCDPSFTTMTLTDAAEHGLEGCVSSQQQGHDHLIVQHLHTCMETTLCIQIAETTSARFQVQIQIGLPQVPQRAVAAACCCTCSKCADSLKRNYARGTVWHDSPRSSKLIRDVSVRSLLVSTRQG